MPSLSEMLRKALSKFTSASSVDKRVVEELIRDIQRALLMADVNVELVKKLSDNIRERAFLEKAPPGISRKDHVIKVVYEELVKLLGEKPAKIEVTKKPYVIMMVGIQGTGKTTSIAKIANYLKKKGYRVGVICADTYRPGAHEQLRQLLDGRGIPVFHLEKADAVEIARKGIEHFKSNGFDVILIDTAGRHRSQETLMEEMRMLQEKVKPDEVMLIIDATIGQMAGAHAKAFHQVAPVGSIILTKMDTSARGGGALSAVAETGARIKFIGTGEKLDDIELFNPKGYVGRLLGLGDIEGLLEKIRLAEIEVSEEKAKEFLRGEFSLEEFVKQLKEVRKAGPLSKLLSRLPIPGLPEMPSDAFREAEEKIEKWSAIIQSMTEDERRDPSILNSSRVRRIARGAGVTERDVKNLIKQYKLTKKLMKSAKRGPQRLLSKLYKP
ncbi:MAG: signal recognition particle protein [Candidatus Wolframiiraptor sp.]|nr:MAG: signal recognition particle protein [Candidatus Wolframiiraptor sp.]